MGRPTLYTDDLAAEICGRLAEGESMRSISRDDAMPSMFTLFKWLRDNDEFSKQYARAKEESADSHADKIEDIANGVLEGRFDPQAARVAMDGFKWTASKLKPKKYGDKIDVSAHVTTESHEDWLKRLEQESKE